jgi:hypothetical protein
MSKEMRKLIDDFNTFNNRKLNEGFFNDMVSGAKSSWKRNVSGTYKEPIFIWIFNKNGKTTIQNNDLSSNVNIKIMDILNDKFNLNLDKDKNGYYTCNIFDFDYSKIDDVSDFLINIGLERKDFDNKGLVFKGKLSMRDLK